MQKEFETDTLFNHLSKICEDAGYLLEEIKITARPNASANLTQVRIRTRDSLDRLPAPDTVEAFFGG